MIVLGEKDHTFVNEHEKIQSCNYLACLMLTLITQIPEPSITKLLLTPYKLIGKSEVGGVLLSSGALERSFCQCPKVFPVQLPSSGVAPGASQRYLPGFSWSILSIVLTCRY